MRLLLECQSLRNVSGMRAGNHVKCRLLVCRAPKSLGMRGSKRYYPFILTTLLQLPELGFLSPPRLPLFTLMQCTPEPWVPCLALWPCWWRPCLCMSLPQCKTPLVEGTTGMTGTIRMVHRQPQGVRTHFGLHCQPRFCLRHLQTAAGSSPSCAPSQRCARPIATLAATQE